MFLICMIHTSCQPGGSRVVYQYVILGRFAGVGMYSVQVPHDTLMTVGQDLQ